MAPSAVETITVPVPEVNPVKLQSAHHRGVYKELAPVAFDKEAELVGKEGFQAAKVRFIKPYGRYRWIYTAASWSHLLT